MNIFSDYVKWMQQERDAQAALEELRPQVEKALATLDEMHESEKALIRQEHERERGSWIKAAEARIVAACRGLHLTKNAQDDILAALKKRQKQD